MLHISYLLRKTHPLMKNTINFEEFSIQKTERVLNNITEIYNI